MPANWKSAFNHPRDPFQAPGGLLHFKSTILWHIIPEVVVFTLVAFAIVQISRKVTVLDIPATLITVFGTVLGFIISYRTSSAYQQYSEGRKLWSNLQSNTRTFARLIWFHVLPGPSEKAKSQFSQSEQEEQIKILIEKQTILNLLGGYAIALKHLLRSEKGIFYKDLFPLIGFLDVFQPVLSPKNHHLGSASRARSGTFTNVQEFGTRDDSETYGSFSRRNSMDQLNMISRTNSLVLEAQTERVIPSHESINLSRNTSVVDLDSLAARTTNPWTPAGNPSETPLPPPRRVRIQHTRSSSLLPQPFRKRLISPIPLLPSRLPPPIKWVNFIPFFDLFLDVYYLFKRFILYLKTGKTQKQPPLALNLSANSDDETEKEGEDFQGNVHIPLSLIHYFTGYVSSLQTRQALEVPIMNGMLLCVSKFEENLTDLERVLTTPIPVAYSLHLRHTVWIYLFLLPAQLHATFGWLAIPATAISAFVFLGFIQIGQEIEFPFGYDEEDLDLDGYCINILRELREITSRPPVQLDPTVFAMVEKNLPFATPPLYEGNSASQILQSALDGRITLREVEQLMERNGKSKTIRGSELRRMESLAKVAGKVTVKRKRQA